ncbi:MAG: translocation/assembly module TamB domain-containing protein [Sideroxydans sp.]|nr:translocation/assembly module TamB domain-containing protein [Sideroxydans sp.]
MVIQRFAPSRRQLLWLALLTPLAMVAAGGSWLLGTQSGLIWVSTALQKYSGEMLEIEGEHGALMDNFGMRHLLLRGEGWRVTLQDVEVHWRPVAFLHGELHVLQLQAKSMDVLTLPADTATAMPEDISLPLAIKVEQFDVGSLRLSSSENAEPDLQADTLRVRFTADSSGHRLQVAEAHLPYGDLVGTLGIAPRAPYAVQATASLETVVPMRAGYQVEVSGDLQHLDVALNAAGEGMSMHGTAQLLPLAAVPLANAELSFKGLATNWLDAEAPPARLNGELELRGTKKEELEGSLSIQNQHAAPLDKAGLPLRSLQSRLRWSERYWQLYGVEARIGESGRVAGELDWRPQSREGAMRLQVSRFDPGAIDTRAPHLNLDGEIALGSTGSEQQARIALIDGALVIDGGLHRRGDLIALHALRFARGETELIGEGELRLDHVYTFSFDSHLHRLDLREFTDISATDLNAVLHASGTLLPQPEVALDFELEQSRFSSYAIDGGGQLHFNGKQKAEGEIELRIGANTLNAELAYGTAADYFKVILDAPKLEQLGGAMRGQLSGQAELLGSLAEPVISFTLGGINLALSDGGSIEQIDAGGHYDAQSLALQLTASGVRAQSGMGMTDLRVEANGSRAQHSLQGAANLTRNEQPLGRWHFETSGGLSETEEAWQWLGSLDALQADGILPLRLQAPATLSLAPGKVALGAARLALGGGEVSLQETQWTQQAWHSAGRFSGLGVRAVNLQQFTQPTEAFDTMRFGGDWDITSDTHWQGHASIQRESGDLLVDPQSGQQLGLQELSLSMQVVQDVLSLQLVGNGTRLGEVAARVKVPLSQQDGAWTVEGDAPLEGHVTLRGEDLTWIGPVLHDNLQSGGSLSLDADLRGTFGVPRLQGAVQGDNLRVALLDQGVKLEQGSLRARLETNNVHIDKLQFAAPYLPKPDDKLLDDYRLPEGAGQLSASGRIDLEGADSDLQVQLAALPLAQRADRWLIVSGDGHIGYASRTLSLHGNIRADAGLIAQIETGKPRWSDDVKIIGQDERDQNSLAYDIDAGFDLGDHFYLRTAGLESRLSGQLRLKGEAGSPMQATGLIATQDGLFNAYGQQLTVERGMVNFQGPPEDPGLNILALRKGLTVEAGVEVTGTARHPVIRLVSTPVVPDAEKLSWIVLGRVPESGSIDSSLLLAAAGNLLGGQSVGQLGRSLGVDELSLRQRETGDALQNQVVTVGKRLSSRAYLSYEQGLSDVGGLTKFTYTLTPRITIVTRTGTEDALDLFYSFRFY